MYFKSHSSEWLFVLAYSTYNCNDKLPVEIINNLNTPLELLHSSNLLCMHIGEKIKVRLEAQKISIVEFAELLEISKASTHRLLKRSSIDTDLLYKICFILKYDFFQDYSARIDDRDWKSNQYLKVKFKSLS